MIAVLKGVGTFLRVSVEFSRDISVASAAVTLVSNSLFS